MARAIARVISPAVAGCVVAAALPPALGAQTPPVRRDTSRAVVGLDSLHISVTRELGGIESAPAAITRIDAATIRDGRLTVGLDESLARVPGLVVNNRYNFSLGSRISIRGFGSRSAFGVRGIRVIADGIPLTMPDGQTNLNSLDLGAASHIDVIRGPASSLYGNAAGGVIAIESEQPPPDPAASARLTFGTLSSGDPGNLRKLQAKTGGARGNVGGLVSVSRLDVDGFRDFSRARQTVVNVMGRYTPDPASRLSVVFNIADSPVAQSPGALPIDSARLRPTIAWPNNKRTGSGEATTHVQGGLAYSRLAGGGRFDAAAYALSRDVDNALPFGYILLERTGGGARGTYAGTVDIASMPLAVSVGADAELQRDARREYDNVGGARGNDLRRDQVDRVASVGPFAQARLSLNDALSLAAGVRYDAIRFETSDAFPGDGDDSGERTLHALSPHAGAIVSLSERVDIFANVATSFQTPTTTELINAPPAPGQSCCPGGFNADLDPERARSVEVGVRAAAGPVRIDAAAYAMTVRNTIVPFQVAEVPAREFFRNAGRTRNRGFELSVDGTLGRHDATVSYTFSDFTFIDDGLPAQSFEGNRLPGVPRHHLFGELRLRPLDAVRIEAQVDHSGEYFTTDANAPGAVNDAWTVVDLRLMLEQRLGSTVLSPFAAIANLTDARYNSSVVVNAAGARYYEPAPRRNYYIGMAVTFGGRGRS